jgi:Pyruvate/2-oxoacid:ferredoxin oxidoreductase gamma subunit
VREIRWHGRAGQGAKTASLLYDPSLVKEVDPCEGLAPDGLLLVNSEVELPVPHPGRTVWVPASRLSPGAHVNVVMLGALAAALVEPSLDDLRQAATELFGKKKRAALASAIEEIEAGYAAVGEVRWAA